MSDFTGVEWQPISQLPVFEQLIGGMLAETLAFHDTLAGAVGRPQALDDATLDHVQRQYRERAEVLDLYEEQFRRWRAAGLSSEQKQRVDGFSGEVQRTRPLVGQVLAMVDQLRADSIDRVTELSDLELGLMTVLGLTPAEFKKWKQQQRSRRASLSADLKLGLRHRLRVAFVELDPAELPSQHPQRVLALPEQRPVEILGQLEPNLVALGVMADLHRRSGALRSSLPGPPRGSAGSFPTRSGRSGRSTRPGQRGR